MSSIFAMRITMFFYVFFNVFLFAMRIIGAWLFVTKPLIRRHNGSKEVLFSARGIEVPRIRLIRLETHTIEEGYAGYGSFRNTPNITFQYIS